MCLIDFVDCFQKKLVRSVRGNSTIQRIFNLQMAKQTFDFLCKKSGKLYQEYTNSLTSKMSNYVTIDLSQLE